jgi:hypothetical protein
VTARPGLRCAACHGRLVRVHDERDVFLLGPNVRHVEGPCPAPRLRLPADPHGPLVRPVPLVRGERGPRQVRP